MNCQKYKQLVTQNFPLCCLTNFTHVHLRKLLHLLECLCFDPPVACNTKIHAKLFHPIVEISIRYLRWVTQKNIDYQVHAKTWFSSCFRLAAGGEVTSSRVDDVLYTTITYIYTCLAASDPVRYSVVQSVLHVSAN